MLVVWFCLKTEEEVRRTGILKRSSSVGLVRLIQNIEGDGGYWYIEPRKVVSEIVNCYKAAAKNK